MTDVAVLAVVRRRIHRLVSPGGCCSWAGKPPWSSSRTRDVARSAMSDGFMVVCLSDGCPSVYPIRGGPFVRPVAGARRRNWPRPDEACCLVGHDVRMGAHDPVSVGQLDPLEVVDPTVALRQRRPSHRNVMGEDEPKHGYPVGAPGAVLPVGAGWRGSSAARSPCRGCRTPAAPAGRAARRGKGRRPTTPPARAARPCRAGSVVATAGAPTTGGAPGAVRSSR